MPHHSETRQISYTPAQLYGLVADIERYPEFLPWCKGARITDRGDGFVIADLIIGYKMFQEKFTSEVTLHEPHAITVRYVSGPLARLTNAWQFEPDKDGCKLSFQVDFDFTSPFLQAIIEPFFDKALYKMVAAFEERAKELYG